jgi:peroxiredoxin
MKTIRIPTFFSLIILLAPLALLGRVETGSTAPDFTLRDSNGEERTLSDFKGQHVVLEWTNHECPFVKKHYASGNMQNLQRTYTGKGVAWLTILSSGEGNQGCVSAEKANELIQTAEASPTAYLLDYDGTVGRKYTAQTTPHIFVIDPEGQLVYQGAIDDVRSADPADIVGAKNYVSLALGESMSGKPVSVSDTQPYGCSVKYGSK